MTFERKTYEILWNSAGNRRSETVEAHDYETNYDPVPYLFVFDLPKKDAEGPQERFELIGHNFTIRPVEKEE